MVDYVTMNLFTTLVANTVLAMVAAMVLVAAIGCSSSQTKKKNFISKMLIPI
jgi:VIT1/CCC1 family predicted Fe2+/Mn2+ transporter